MTIDVIFSFVLAAALQAGVVGLVLLAVRLLLRKRLSARWLCVLWLVLLCKLVVPYGPESTLSLFNAAPPEVREAVTATVIPAVPADGGVLEAASAPQSQAAGASGFDWRTAAAWVWIAGGGGFALWLLSTRALLAWRLRRHGRPAPERVQALLAQCCGRMGWKRGVKIVVQDCVASPSLVGVLRPKILLPAYACDMPDEPLSYVLLHELAHAKRGDALVNALLLALRAVYWFQPVLWLCFYRLRQDIELAADECVLQELDSGERTAYGESLLTTLHHMASVPAAPHLLGLVNGKRSLRSRLRRIARFRRSGAVCTAAGMALVLALSAVCLTSAQTLLPEAAASVLAPVLPAEPDAAPEPKEEEALPQTASPSPAASGTPSPAPSFSPTPEPSAVPGQQVPTAEPAAADPLQKPLPAQQIKPVRRYDSVGVEVIDLLPGTTPAVLERYAREAGRTAGTAAQCDLQQEYGYGTYTLSAETPVAAVSVRPDQNGNITCALQVNVKDTPMVQLIAADTGRLVDQTSYVEGTALAFVGLDPAQTYVLRLEQWDDGRCTGTLVVY